MLNLEVGVLEDALQSVVALYPEQVVMAMFHRLKHLWVLIPLLKSWSKRVCV